MKTKTILLIIFGILIIGAVLLIVTNFDKDIEVEPSVDEEEVSGEELEDGLKKSISVSTKEELFSEIRNSVDEHLRS
jgi:hypothetical protein